jgi:hypothetical protein
MRRAMSPLLRMLILDYSCSACVVSLYRCIPCCAHENTSTSFDPPSPPCPIAPIRVEYAPRGTPHIDTSVQSAHAPFPSPSMCVGSRSTDPLATIEFRLHHIAISYAAMRPLMSLASLIWSTSCICSSILEADAALVIMLRRRSIDLRIDFSPALVAASWRVDIAAAGD